jgi:hypothetical protein
MNNDRDIRRTIVEKDKGANDFYNKYDPFEVTILDEEDYEKYMEKLKMTDKQKAIYESDFNYYEIQFSNIGGLVMPIILKFTYEDGGESIFRIPAEIWRMNQDKVTKVFATAKPVSEFALDPYMETADIDMVNNHWPRKMIPSKFELFKQKSRSRGQGAGGNKMKRAKKVEERLKENKDNKGN